MEARKKSISFLRQSDVSGCSSGSHFPAEVVRSRCRQQAKTAAPQRQGRNSGISTPGIWTVKPWDRKARSNCNRKSSRTVERPATDSSRFLQPADLSILAASRMRPVRTMEANSFRALSVSQMEVRHGSQVRRGCEVRSNPRTERACKTCAIHRDGRLALQYAMNHKRPSVGGTERA